jgi:hypothetical protein
MNAPSTRHEPEAADLSRLLPPPAERDLPAGRRSVLKEHLTQELRRAAQPLARPASGWRQPGASRGAARRQLPARRRPRTALLAAGAAAAVLAAGVTAALNRPSPHAQPPVGYAQPGTPTARLLGKIAGVAGREPAPAVRDDQFVYIDSKVSFEVTSVSGGKVTNTMTPPHRRQIWLSVSNLCRTGLLAENGRTALGRNQGEKCPDAGSLNDPTYRLLASLPTDPQALLARINTEEKGAGPGPAAEAFTTIGDLLRESIAPPQVSAALYRAAALIPGVTVVPQAVDAVGRPGVAVALDSSGTRTEWIFDRTTLQLLGEREIDLATGAVTGSSAILHRAVVNHPGQVPAGQG